MGTEVWDDDGFTSRPAEPVTPVVELAQMVDQANARSSAPRGPQLAEAVADLVAVWGTGWAGIRYAAPELAKALDQLAAAAGKPVTP